jgi:predicted nuclease of predicted toxin-antitoxin system
LNDYSVARPSKTSHFFGLPRHGAQCRLRATKISQQPEKMKGRLDCSSTKVWAWLLLKCFEVSAGTFFDVSEAGLVGHPDENVFGYALKHDRILLTHDADFLDDRKFPFDNNRNPGVVVLPGGSGGDSILIRALNLALEMCNARELFRGSKIVISPEGVLTIRQRNLETGAIESTEYRKGRHRLEQWES